MTQPPARFTGAIVGDMPDALATSSTKANELTSTVWTLALAVGDQMWEETWSPTLDERRRNPTDPRHVAASRARRKALHRAKDKFEGELAQRLAANHPVGTVVHTIALARERVRAGEYYAPAAPAAPFAEHTAAAVAAAAAATRRA